MDDLPAIAATLLCLVVLELDMAARQETERQTLRDPSYRMGDPAVHPDDRIGF